MELTVGMLRSKTNRQGLVVNGVMLGVAPLMLADGTPPPPETTTDDVWFVWSHEALPTGIVRADGGVTLD
jgi:hypothetical protein